MFSLEEKQKLAAAIEKLLLELDHPEMPVERPNFTLHVDGKEPWSWANIVPNWKAQENPQPINSWNEISRDVLREKGE